jgi:hypothetical protein
MKHLRKFNENKTDVLREFISDSLAFILDKGFVFYLSQSRYEDNVIDVNIYHTENNFYWDDVKYDIIPLLLMLNNKSILFGYSNIVTITYFRKDYSPASVGYTIGQIENDDTKFPKVITEIEFKINLK